MVYNKYVWSCANGYICDFVAGTLFEKSLALTFSFGEKVSKKNFNFVKSIFEEH